MLPLKNSVKTFVQHLDWLRAFTLPKKGIATAAGIIYHLYKASNPPERSVPDHCKSLISLDY